MGERLTIEALDDALAIVRTEFSTVVEQQRVLEHRRQNLKAVVLHLERLRHNLEEGKETEIGGTMKCLQCGTEIDEGEGWCSSECREEYQKAHPDAPYGPSMPKAGKCKWCNTKTEPGKDFCDEICKDDYEANRKHESTPGVVQAGAEDGR